MIHKMSVAVTAVLLPLLTGMTELFTKRVSLTQYLVMTDVIGRGGDVIERLVSNDTVD